MILRVQIYCGKSEIMSDHRNHSTSVVLSLMNGSFNIGHVLYMDNFYNALSLSKVLTLRSTYICETLRSNRIGKPKEWVKQKLKKGEYSWKRSETVVCKWRDKETYLPYQICTMLRWLKFLTEICLHVFCLIL